MSESRQEGMDVASDPPPVKRVRTEEPQPPFGPDDEANPDAVADLTADEKQGSGESLDPGTAGYEGRDPKTEMPRIPSVPETQDEAVEHGGAPGTKKEPSGPAPKDRLP